jgi:hypothetical protein
MGEGNAATKEAKERTSDAAEVQVIIYLRDGAKQQEQKKKDDKKRKEITKPNHTTEWTQEWLMMFTQLDGTGRRTRTAIKDDITGTTKDTPQRHERKGGTRKKSTQHGSAVGDSLQLPRPNLCNCLGQPLLLPKGHPHPGPSLSCATAQECGGTNWNLRGFSRTRRRVTKSH